MAKVSLFWGGREVAGLVAAAETREAVNQSFSNVIQNLEATLANSTTPLLPEQLKQRQQSGLSIIFYL